jgi:hypothetical protein
MIILKTFKIFFYRLKKTEKENYLNNDMISTKIYIHINKKSGYN